MTPSVPRRIVTTALILLFCAGCGQENTFVAPVHVGTLLVESLPYGIEGSWTVVGPGGFEQQGTAHGSFSGLAAGDYTVTWQDVAGWHTPDAVTRSVVLGEAETADGTYESRIWSALDSNVDTDLLDVYFLDADLGWAVGEAGVIIHTTDGGATWIQQDSDTNVDLNGVSFCDANNGCVAGDDVTILRTVDGGTSWWRSTIVIPTDWWGNPVEDPPGDFIGVELVTPDMGTVVGFGGSIYHSIVGGDNWRRQNLAVRTDFYAVDFQDTRAGTAVGANGLIMRTYDGGSSWRSMDSGTEVTLAGVFFSDVHTGTAVGRDGTILRTVDDGTTWTVQDSGGTGFLYDVSFVDATRGTVVGEGGVVLNTTDGGLTWMRQAGGTFRFLMGVQFLNNEFGTMVGVDGMMFRTVSGPAPAPVSP